jgi:hypothetical protein
MKTYQELLNESANISNLTAQSPAIQLLGVAVTAANSGEPISPNVTTDQILALVRQWQTQPDSDVKAIIIKQLLQFFQSNSRLQLTSDALTQLISSGDQFPVIVPFAGASVGDYVSVAVANPATITGGEWSLFAYVAAADNVVINVRGLGLLATQCSGTRFNVAVTKSAT